MELLADRFVRTRAGTIVDLASGRPIVFRDSSAGDLAEQSIWADRCAALSGVRHPHLVELVDFGPLGRTGRFEAFARPDSCPAWRGRDQATVRALTGLVDFLHARGLSVGRLSWDRIVCRDGRPALMPGGDTGLRLGRATPNEDRSGGVSPGCEPTREGERDALTQLLHACGQAEESDQVRGGGRGLRGEGVEVIPALAIPIGVAIQPMALIGRLIELLEGGRAGVPRCVEICGPPGAGATTLVRQVAREARLRGFVPFSTSAVADAPSGGLDLQQSSLRTLLEGRHVLVVHDLPAVPGRRDRSIEGLKHDRGVSLDGTRSTGHVNPVAALSSAILALGVASDRPHLLLVTRRHPTGLEPFFHLDPWPAARLRSMVSVAGLDPETSERALADAARRAGGRPGAFIRALSGEIDRTAEVEPVERLASRGIAQVAESGAQYGPSISVLSGVGSKASDESRPPAAVGNLAWGSSAWPLEASVLPGLTRARAKAASGWVEACRGRHAVGERLLRDALGALARRGDELHAGRAALNLGRLLLERGRAQDAASTFQIARAHFGRANRPDGAIRATVYLGVAWTDDGRLRDAEAALRSARIAAVQTGDATARTLAHLGLARCLYWQGRHDEAQMSLDMGEDTEPMAGDKAEEAYPARALMVSETADQSFAATVLPSGVGALAGQTEPSIEGDPFGPDPDRRVLACDMAARIALALGRLPTAGARAAAALERAEALDAPLDLCRAHATMAALHAAVGDVEALRRHVQDGLRAARRGHAPLRALRCRLWLIEGLARAGKQRDARAAATRLDRLRLGSLPGILRARTQLVRAGLLADTDRATSERASALEFVRLTGAKALETERRHVRGRSRSRAWDLEGAVIGDVIDVLEICHDCEDERVAVVRVAALVRERTRAATVAFFGVEPHGLATLAVAGPPISRLLSAQRAIETGLTIAPARSMEGFEGAAPIRYGSTTIGALGCRWTADATIDPHATAALLSAAAIAVAPSVWTALDLKKCPPAAMTGEVDLIGTSPAIAAVRQVIARAAATPFPVLIEGETGSGKELVARAIHRESPRRGRAFCALNCAALTDDLIEAELFGHARGAFTGAVSERIGLFEEANGGTLFLDEVGELSPRAQAKLLRVIQEGEVRRVGENFARGVDVRLIAATNRRLVTEVAAARFRQDLLYRLDVIRVVVPPLRDRIEDIPALATYFWNATVARVNSRARLAPGTLAALARYDWPGNVREMQNIMAALAVTAPRRGSVGPASLPEAVARTTATGPQTSLEEARRLFERRFVRAALARAGGRRGRTAADLGVSRQGLAKLLVRLGIGEEGGVGSSQ